MDEIGLKSKPRLPRLNLSHSVEIRRKTKNIPSKFILIRRNSSKIIAKSTDKVLTDKVLIWPKNRPIYEKPTSPIRNMMDNQDSDVSK